VSKKVLNPETVAAFIKTGAENGISLRELCQRTNADGRTVRKTVETLRREGNVICSGMTGYYHPADACELRDYVKQEECRARSIFYTLKAARKALKKLEAVKEK